MFSNNSSAKICSKYFCEKCDYKTSKKSSYDDHLISKRHNKSIISNEESAEFCPPKFICKTCNKSYKDNSGLWRHKKKCSNMIDDLKNELSSEDKQQELIQYLLKENSEFKQLMIEQNKHMLELAKNTGNNNNNNISNVVNNNNNQQFNLQFFLNETCKNAMNIMDFVNQLQIGNNDLEETGRLGFANGISRIFINGLKKMNIPDRPIHCSDFKRETIYIKNNNEWNKESDQKLY